MGLVRGNYACYLVRVAVFMGFGQAGAKRWETCFKVMNWGGNTSHEMGTLCIGKGGSHYVRLLYCETLL